METCVPASTINVSCVWCHWRFPLRWLTDLDLYVFFEFTIFQISMFSYDLSMNTWVPASTINVLCFWISWAFPYTLAYRFGFRCLFWIHDVSQIYLSYEFAMKTWVPASAIIVSCVWFHRRFPLLWLTDLDLYVCFDPTNFLKPIGWSRWCCEMCDGSLSHL